MVLGIVSVVTSLFWPLSVPAGIAAIVLAILGKRKEPSGKPFWLTGLITGIVGLVLSILFLILAAIAIAAFQQSGVGTGTIEP
jgi:4-amino-4-deoxy-L-arabinose transferase-like glycosyltransferase